MMEAASPLNRSALSSAMAGKSMIHRKNGKHRRTMVASLMLTSLVDAFSILVIFLIMNHSANQEILNVGEKITLPTAQESQFIQEGVVVRVENGVYVVDDTPVGLASLVAKLKTLNKSVEAARRDGLIIVADRNLDYEALSPVILAGSQSGFTKFKFAVISKK